MGKENGKRIISEKWFFGKWRFGVFLSIWKLFLATLLMGFRRAKKLPWICKSLFFFGVVWIVVICQEIGQQSRNSERRCQFSADRWPQQQQSQFCVVVERWAQQQYLSSNEWQEVSLAGRGSHTSTANKVNYCTQTWKQLVGQTSRHTPKSSD